MTVSTGTIEGFFKTKYKETVEHALPSFALLQERLPFSESEKIGKDYRFPVFLTRSHGVTFNGGTATNGTAYSLNDAISPISDEAIVLGMETTIREKIAYKVLAAATKRGPEAFDNAMAEITMQVKESAMMYTEQAMLYGQSPKGIGEIQGGTVDGGTSQTFQITKATWAPGLWAQMEGAKVDVWDDDYNPLRGATTQMIVTAVDLDNRLVTLTGTEADLDAVAVGDFITPIGWISATTPTWEVMAGVRAILANTGSLFGIDASVYSGWKANSFAVGSAQLTAAAIIGGVGKAVNRGMKGKMTVLLSEFTWVDVMNDLSALRRYVEKAGGGIEQGSTSVTLYGPNNGPIELLAHPMVYAGEALGLSEDYFKRIGATDTTFKFNNATGQNENMFTELADSNGCQIRCYSDQALIATRPARMVHWTGIVNQSLPNAATETTAAP